MPSALRTRRHFAASGLAARVLASLLLGTLLVAPAQASPDTLRRSFSNILNGPLDMLMSPITATLGVATNLQDVDDTPAVRIGYALPGLVWLTGLSFGCGALRSVTGALEFLPGVALFGFESDLDPLFDPVEDAAALVDWDNPLADSENPWLAKNPLVTPFTIRAKFGIDYTKADY